MGAHRPKLGRRLPELSWLRRHLLIVVVFNSELEVVLVLHVFVELDGETTHRFAIWIAPVIVRRQREANLFLDHLWLLRLLLLLLSSAAVLVIVKRHGHVHCLGSRCLRFIWA